MFEAVSALFPNSDVFTASEWKPVRSSGDVTRHNSEAVCFRVVNGQPVKTHHDPFQPFCNLPSDVCVVLTQN
jgi:hypothetical protein